MTPPPDSRALPPPVERYRARTPRCLEALERARRFQPLGVSSNLRAWPPHPIVFDRAQGCRVWDLDGNEYIDYGLAQGTLMAGHANPVVLEAVRRQMERGTVFAAPHAAEAELAELLLKRYPFFDQLRFTTTGSEAVLHAVRLARAATGRRKILKVEGTYHGNYDAVLASYTPPVLKAGHARRPVPVPMSQGLTPGALEDTRVFPFDDPEALESILAEHRNQVAAVLFEPVMLNLACLVASDGYFQKVRKMCDEHGALLIFDEVKTGAKVAYGGAPELYGVQPDIVCVSKSIGGGFPLGAFISRRDLMNEIAEGRSMHSGTFAGNPVSVAAGIATLRDVLPREAYTRLAALNGRLAQGLEESIRRRRLRAYVNHAGVCGAVVFSEKKIQNYRDWLGIRAADWEDYWYGMLVRGVIPQSYGRDDSWTVSVAHTEKEIDAAIAAFDEAAAEIAAADRA